MFFDHINRFLFAVVCCALLYGGLNYLLGGLILPGADFITFRPQLLIPVMFSLVVNPWAGGLIAMSGNFFGDCLLGYGLLFWPWSIANFFIGFIPGTVRWWGIKRIESVNAFIMVLVFVFLGNAIALFIGFTAHVLLHGGSTLLFTLRTFYVPAVISNTYILMLLVPPMLIVCRFLRMNIETRAMFLFLTISLGVLTIVVAAVFSSQFIGFSALDAVGNDSNVQAVLQQMIVRHFNWIGIALLVILIAAASMGYYFSSRFMQPVMQLAEAANLLKQGQWEETSNISIPRANDEMTNLIQLFNTMAKEVHQREARMSREIERLQLTIDKKKEDKIVEEITETDFFKKLEEKSLRMRKERKSERHNNE
jgi:hypothetical protein